MDLNAFRAETREWIEANCPEVQKGLGRNRSAVPKWTWRQMLGSGSIAWSKKGGLYHLAKACRRRTRATSVKF